MFFEELVEQHGVNLLVADGLGLPAGIASTRSGAVQLLLQRSGRKQVFGSDHIPC
jgi:hypothetical protein